MIIFIFVLKLVQAVDWSSRRILLREKLLM
jgi:hypothetical protein